MRKYFKTRRKKFKIFYYLVIIFVAYYLSDTLFNSISHDFMFIENPLYNFKINRDKLLINMGLNYTSSNKVPTVIPTFDELDIKPTIYLYNTHQTENYVDYDIYNASINLCNILNENGVNCVLETTNIASLLSQNNLKYKDSYKITRDLLLKQSTNYDLYIDLHRDSSKREVTLANIDNHGFAKIMFVSGGNNSNYMMNYQVMDDLNKKIKNIDQNLSRGIYFRKGSHYNQDLNPRIILIELGGVENNLEEVNNSIKVLARVLIDYLSE